MKTSFMLLVLGAVFVLFPISLGAQSGNERKANPAGSEVSGVVKSVNAAKKSFVLRVGNEDVTVSAAKMARLPKVGAMLRFTPSTQKFIFPSCEECNAKCPGVCFMTSGMNCRCYLEHL